MSGMNTWVDAVLGDILGRRSSQGEVSSAETTVMPPVDIFETPESLVLLVEMPGVDEKGVELSLTDETLSITGRPTVETTSGARTWGERTVGAFQRRFRLDTQVFDREKIEAVVKNGLLRVTLPKTTDRHTRQIPVKGA